MHNPEPPSVVTGRRFLYDAELLVEPRRLVLRELPRLRRLRQPGVGPRQPGRGGDRQPRPLHQRPLQPGHGAAHGAHLPPDEGPDDDAEPARHGQPRPDALARRPHRRQRRADRAAGQRDLRRAGGVRQVQRGVPRSARAPRDHPAGGHGRVHRLHPPDHVSAEPQPAARQRAHRGSGGRAPALRQRQLRHPVGSGARGRRPHVQRVATRSTRTPTPAPRRPGSSAPTGFSSFDFNPQLFKIPHLRNVYQKVGMFGNPENPGFLPADNSFQGDQVRGFGFLHDGSIDTVFRFTHGISFSELANGPGNNGIPDGPAGDVQRRQLEAFLLAFPTNLAPVVGQQITLTAGELRGGGRPRQPPAPARGRGGVRSRRQDQDPRRRGRLPVRGIGLVRERSARAAAHHRRGAAVSGHGLRPPRDVHLRAARLRRAHRRGPRRGRLLGRRRASRLGPIRRIRTAGLDQRYHPGRGGLLQRARPRSSPTDTQRAPM